MGNDGWLELIKGDLNRLYTEPPFMTPLGPDAGWFCREHALHTFIVGSMLGHRLRLVEGDVVLGTSGRTLSTVGEGGHAWCVGPGAEILDASIFLQFHDGFPAVGAIEEGRAGAGNFRVVAVPEATEDQLKAICQGGSTIAFAPRQVLDFRPEDLVARPFDFVFRPADGTPSLSDKLGKDIFNQIHFHLFRLVQGQGRSVATMSPKRAFKAIRKENKQARRAVLMELGRQVDSV